MQLMIVRRPNSALTRPIDLGSSASPKPSQRRSFANECSDFPFKHKILFTADFPFGRYPVFVFSSSHGMTKEPYLICTLITRESTNYFPFFTLTFFPHDTIIYSSLIFSPFRNPAPFTLLSSSTFFLSAPPCATPEQSPLSLL